MQISNFLKLKDTLNKLRYGDECVCHLYFKVSDFSKLELDVYMCMCSDVYKIQEGIGDKVGMLIQGFTGFVVSFIIGLSKGWKLTLVILAVSPVLGISAALFSMVSCCRSLSLCF